MSTQTRHNGCFDRAPYAINIPMQDSIRVHGLMVTHGIRHVPHAMTKDCQYQHTDLGKADKGCDGCKWREPTDAGQVPAC